MKKKKKIEKKKKNWLIIENMYNRWKKTDCLFIYKKYLKNVLGCTADTTEQNYSDDVSAQFVLLCLLHNHVSHNCAHYIYTNARRLRETCVDYIRY